MKNYLEELHGVMSDSSKSDAEVIGVAQVFIQQLQNERSRWLTIASNLADESQITERLQPFQIKQEIGLTDSEYDELISY